MSTPALEAYHAFLDDHQKRLEGWFSNLRRTRDYAVTSKMDPTYNCAAYAIDKQDAWWWPPQSTLGPAIQSYWPQGVPTGLTMDVFVQLYAQYGYTPCDLDDKIELGYEKIALYEKSGRITHVAKQMESGRWKSKLGRWEDIDHTLDGLAGQGQHEYGSVAKILKRPKSTPQT